MRFTRMTWQRKPHSDRRRTGVLALALAAALALPALAAAQLPVLHGRVVPADSMLPLAPEARIVVDWGGEADTVGVDRAGRFSSLLRPIVGDSATLTVLGGAAFYPARLRIARGSPGKVEVVLVPRRWVVRAGTYAGDTVVVSPSAALGGARAPFGRVAAARSAPLRGLVAWQVERMPIPLAIHRTPARYVSAADSVALWRTIAALERDLGATFFRPADDSTVQREGWGIDVRVDPTITGSGLTFDTWGNGGLLFDASIAVRHARDFGDASILHHELLHALGFGHATVWRSIMTRTASSAVTALTREDVAYVQLLLRVGELQRALGTRYGLVAAAEGERWEGTPPRYRLSKSSRSSVQPSTW